MKILEPKLNVAVKANNYMGESPIWSAELQSLFWINCEDPPQIHSWDTRTGERRVWPMPDRVGGLVLKRGGNAIVVLADGVYNFNLADGALQRIVSSPMKHAALHECACDRAGRLWVGAIDHRIGKPDLLPGGGSLFRLEGDQLVTVLEGVSCSNGLAFSPDGGTLYHSDAPTGVVEAYKIEPTDGSLSDRREFFRLNPGEGFCDGATVDSEGGYWAALVFGSALRRYLPDGTLDLQISLPFGNPTKIAFGGDDLGTLYITTTRMVLGGEQLSGHDMLGDVFSFRPGVSGLVEPDFVG